MALYNSSQNRDTKTYRISKSYKSRHSPNLIIKWLSLTRLEQFLTNWHVAIENRFRLKCKLDSNSNSVVWGRE